MGRPLGLQLLPLSDLLSHPVFDLSCDVLIGWFLVALKFDICTNSKITTPHEKKKIKKTSKHNYLQIFLIEKKILNIYD